VLRIKKELGFTLIELLVVIAIIAILAAIMFPVYARLKDRARAAACISNQKQLGLAFVVYAGDYDGLLPSNSSAVGNWGDLWWPGYPTAPISPYVKNDQIFYCPSDPTPGKYQKVSYGYGWQSCVMEWQGGDNYIWPTTNKGKRLDDIPVQRIASDQKWNRWWKIYILDEWNGTAASNDGDTIPDCYQWHGKGCHLLLGDSHVQWVNAYAFNAGQ